MPDIWSKQRRSQVMALIRSRGNKDTELKLIRVFKEHRFSGWLRHVSLPGTPDFIFRAYRVAIFVDGCFWHGCPRCYSRPKTNSKFWDSKIARNRERDRSANRELRKRGWRVVRIWQHELSRKNARRLQRKLRHVLTAVDPTP